MAWRARACPGSARQRPLRRGSGAAPRAHKLQGRASEATHPPQSEEDLRHLQQVCVHPPLLPAEGHPGSIPYQEESQRQQERQSLAPPTRKRVPGRAPAEADEQDAGKHTAAEPRRYQHQPRRAPPATARHDPPRPRTKPTLGLHIRILLHRQHKRTNNTRIPRRKSDRQLFSQARTLWCPVNTQTGRPMRVSGEVRAQFSV